MMTAEGRLERRAERGKSKYKKPPRASTYLGIYAAHDLTPGACGRARVSERVVFLLKSAPLRSACVKIEAPFSRPLCSRCRLLLLGLALPCDGAVLWVSLQ